MNHRVPLVLVALLLSACDPAAPSATGVINLDPSIDTTGMTLLHIVAHSDVDGVFQVDDLELEPDQSINDINHSSMSLDEVTFPVQFDTSGGVGTTPVEDWRVTCWLSSDNTQTAPAAGDPWGTVQFKVADCGRLGFCGNTEQVDVTIDALFEAAD